ncbi:MAG TPA: hypothetical protein VFK94_03000, partial [Patescibacteria group bacterium]|nr:hypothetical protein [Patescibacteria group bacterium]
MKRRLRKKDNSGLSFMAEDLRGLRRLRLKSKSSGSENWAEAILPADAEAGQIEPETNRRPLMALAGISLVSVGLLIFRLFSLQVVSGARNLSLADGNRIRQKVVRAPRGVIYDRYQTVLARNQASFELTVIPALLPADLSERDKLYQRVSVLVGLSVSEVKSKSEQKGLRLTQPVVVAAGLERDKALVFDQQVGNMGGFSLDVNPKREYLDGGVMSHLLGYTARISEAELKQHKEYLPTDFIGKLGIENSYEEVLRGVSGSERTEVDAEGRPIKL